MSSSALFASSAGRSHPKNLVECKAGKMTMKGKMVHPDKRKGLLYVYQSEDSLMHFCWKDRTSGSVEDDLIIFPDDCEFKRVETCTTGRVYVLKFKSSRKLFFWIQEPKTDKDDDNCKKINEMLNSPPVAGASRSGGGTPPDELQTLLGSMSQQQLMQLFGTFGPSGPASGQLPSTTIANLLGSMNRSSGNSSTPPTLPASFYTSARHLSRLGADKPATPATADSSKKSSSTSSSGSKAGASATTAPAAAAAVASTPAPSGTIQLSDLQRYLNNIRPVSTPGAAPVTTVEVDLSDALLNAESIQGVLNDPSLVQELSPHLPEVNTDQEDPERVRSTLLSPQFQQAVSMFSAALRSGQIGPVIQQFEMSPPAVLAAFEGNMEEFVKALEITNITPDKKSDGETSSEQKKDSGDKKGDGNGGSEKMNEG